MHLQKIDKSSKNATRGRRPEHEYCPPDHAFVRVSTLEELIRGIRKITPEQQPRFQSDGKVWTVGLTSILQQKCIAIVGTRDVSVEGAARSRRLARELASGGVAIVSGLARGVDTEALSAAIDARGKVIGVIGTPINKAYPAENACLQERIYREHLLVSQFAPGERVYRSNFPDRNRLMAALSDATVIIEAGDTSGSLHQASECVRLGRWLFIAKNVVEDTSVQWPKRFLGHPTVQVLSSVQDILQAIRTN